MKDCKNQKELLQQAFIDARLREAEDSIALSTEEVVFSEAHRRAIEHIYRTGRKPAKHLKTFSPRVLAALLAAALLLLAGGITAYAKREELTRFAESFFETEESKMGIFIDKEEDGYNRLSYNRESKDFKRLPKVEEGTYLPTYIPEGYTEKKRDISELDAFLKWENADGEFIHFSQVSLIRGDTGSCYDNEHSIYDIVTIGNHSVHRVIDVVYGGVTCDWTDGTYAYSIVSSETFSLDEISKIILSVEMLQNCEVTS